MQDADISLRLMIYISIELIFSDLASCIINLGDYYLLPDRFPSTPLCGTLNFTALCIPFILIIWLVNYAKKKSPSNLCLSLFLNHSRCSLINSYSSFVSFLVKNAATHLSSFLTSRSLMRNMKLESVSPTYRLSKAILILLILLL